MEKIIEKALDKANLHLFISPVIYMNQIDYDNYKKVVNDTVKGIDLSGQIYYKDIPIEVSKFIVRGYVSIRESSKLADEKLFETQKAIGLMQISNPLDSLKDQLKQMNIISCNKRNLKTNVIDGSVIDKINDNLIEKSWIENQENLLMKEFNKEANVIFYLAKPMSKEKIDSIQMVGRSKRIPNIEKDEYPDLDMYELLTKAICNAEMSEDSAEFEIEYNYLQLAEKLLRKMKKEKLNYLKKRKNGTD